MREKRVILIALWLAGAYCASGLGQQYPFPPPSNGMRPVDNSMNSGLPTTGQSTMVPINPATQSGIYPSGGTGGSTFDPYASNSASSFPPSSSAMLGAPVVPPVQSTPNPYASPYAGTPYGTNPYATLPPSVPPGTAGVSPGQAPYGATGTYPGTPPSAVYPNPYANGYPNSGNIFQDMYNGVFGAPPPTYPPPAGTGTQPYGTQPYGTQPYGTQPYGTQPYGTYNQWNPQGTMFTNPTQTPDVIRFCQGGRFRQSFILGNDDNDALRIFDSDLSIAFLWPDFCFSSQPLYILPSFSLHQWAGPMPASTADLPPLAYSAFLDAGWQSDPLRLFGGELGLRFGMFSDFNTSTSDSLRLMGRAIARLRCTPNTTLKGGVIYLDRNKTKLLPAFGVVWQPNPNTRIDAFFPEPKLASYLTTHGNTDTWWYVGGYYGGGSWTIQREAGGKDSIDINDIRVLLGLEFGKNEEMRNGRRVGFIEVGYVFDRELLYKNSPMDNMDLQDTIMFRGGIGY